MAGGRTCRGCGPDLSRLRGFERAIILRVVTEQTRAEDASLRIGVALDGAGFHPAAWRDPSARPTELFRARYWIDVARTAERGLLDFLTIEDSFGLQSSRFGRPDTRTDQVRGRLDAVMMASLMAPVTEHIGLIPTAVPTHTEPFHVASAISTLDHISGGRAGWRPQISWRPDEAAHVGLREVPISDRSRPEDPERAAFTAELFDEAADAVEVARRLWDSWEDDAIIRDAPTGRFIDREKLHYIDFSGRFFDVKGPSIVPRPPQGQPVIAALAHSQVPFRFAARAADVVFVTPADTADVAHWIADVRDAERLVERAGAPLKIYGEMVVFVAEREGEALADKERLDQLDGWPYRSDAAIFVGTPSRLADELEAWQAAGLDGFRLRPAVIGHDLDALVDGLVPELQRRRVFRTAYAPANLRQRLGLPPALNRYAPA
ncbi:MAG: FMNH2-utilizing oxygenase [Ilumatobacteraceae bacterium]|nr:FMNH2-utilizing oxygenase [Ilumatobacteraceae bacterium]